MTQLTEQNKTARSDRICHVNTRDRPFYKFEFGNAYIVYLESLGGIIASLIAACILMLALPTPQDAVSATIGIVAGVALVLGYVLTRLIFFVKPADSIKYGLHCSAVASCHFLGAAIVTGWLHPSSIDARWLGIVIMGVAWTFLVVLYRKHGKIGLFTDGMRIGPRVFMYQDITAVGHGTGSDIDAKIPPEGKGKPVRVLTPIVYEYVEKDFGFFHVYLIIVTADAVYVAQSINKQSNLAQDTRNAWSRRVFGHE